ncbi:MAG TPA: hypothetical protein PLI09_00490 [Candidatus Hydrogenedentes bacterium]|nr:hypothetical protein [Candidatus Hydrogenedentota bacterium]
MGYVLVFVFYYLCVLILLAPWWLLLFGSIKRLFRKGGRLRRLQAEGAFLALVGTMAKWIVYDINFGADRLNITEWGYWFNRGEVGIFFIGLLLFGLGYFLERRPRPGLASWPHPIKTVSEIAILSCIALGVVAHSFFNYPWFELPWDSWRILFSLGVLPFSIGYVMLGKKI